MPKSESTELNDLLSTSKKSARNINSNRPSDDFEDSDDYLDEESFSKAYTQWTTHDGKTFLPANRTRQKLTPGVYEVKNNPNVGLYFQKIPTRTDGLVRFPDTNSDKVINEITKFWASEEVFKEYGLPYKRGILLWGPPGCHEAGTAVVMYDGSTKFVEHVRVGDVLMGPDSKPRHVLELRRGRGRMYKVSPRKGQAFVVNGDHVLHLVRSRKGDTHLDERINVTVEEYLTYSPAQKSSYKLPRVRVDHNRRPVADSTKGPCQTTIKSIESQGEGEYFGFILDQDHLYLMDDYTIMHNSGKSCCLQFIMADVVRRSGVVIRFDEPYIFIEGMRVLRTVQPETPVVVVLEDIDSIIEEYHESEVLNILDGVNQAERVVFLATTNHPEALGARIVNRPSRFDKRFKIGFPSTQARKLYLEHVIGNGDGRAGKVKIKELKIDLKKWVKDTDEMSIAHLKELFVAVIIMGDSYEDAIKTLRTMREDVEKSDPEYEDFGFVSHNKKPDDDVDWEAEE